MRKKCSYCNTDGHNSRTCQNLGVRIFGKRLRPSDYVPSAAADRKKEESGDRDGDIGEEAGENEMRKKCSSCNIDGHNSRTCRNHGVRIFGKSLKPSDYVHSASTTDRKKAVQWTEDEHKMFLVGLKKLGRGDWCGIARNYVFTRTPTQIASHAQKYFLRHSADNGGRNRRSSVFDMALDEEAQHAGSSSMSIVPSETRPDHMQNNNSSPAMEPVVSDQPANPNCCYPFFFPSTLRAHPAVHSGFLQPRFPHPVVYSGYRAPALQPQISRPVAVRIKSPIYAEDSRPVAVRIKSPFYAEELDDLPRLSL